MIQIEKTIQKFGYDPLLLSAGSHKLIIVICDYCTEEYIREYKGRDKANSIINKDCCVKCRFKKREEISLKQFGVKNSAQRKDIREKISQTNSEMLKSSEFKDKSKQTMLEKYGVEHALQSSEIQQKIKDTNLNKYGVDNVSKVPEIRAMATQNTIKTKIENGTIKLYNGKTRPQIAKECGFSRSHFGKIVTKYGFEQAIKMEPHVSSLEKLMMDWLDSINIKYISQYKVDNKIADIYIPLHNIIIETDGLYWHSDAIISNKNYHIEKRQLYISKGFTPLFFRENEIVNLDKFKIVQSIIKNKLNLSERIFARKCIIKPVDKSSAKTFFTANHLMGNGSGQTYGLFFSDKLVGAIQIRGHKEGYEIARFCNLLNTNIIGGFSKLLTYIQNNVLNSKSLITFIDLRYGIGSYLTSFNFKYSATYPSFKWTNGREIFNRMVFPSMSGYQNGLSRLWDCGQAKYVLNGV